MEIDIRPDDSVNRLDSSIIEHFMLGLVRLAALPLLVLVIVLSSLIYGIAILSRFIAVLAASGIRLEGTPSSVVNRPIKAQDA